MEQMDRALQRTVLEALAEVYPEQLNPEAMGLDPEDPKINFNIWYLHEHELVSANRAVFIGAPSAIVDATITHKGIDFLADDGGLGAILNVVTVRFEAETLKALLAAKIEASSMPTEEKSKLKKWLLGLGEDALKGATTRLLDAALDQWPGALQLLQTMLD